MKITKNKEYVLNVMTKADLRVCTDCGCVYNREAGLKPFAKCPACGSSSRDTLEL